jgi:alanine racemase
LGGLWTHFAVADEPADGFTAVQIGRFEASVAAVRAVGVHPAVLHAANSAGAIAHPESRYDLVRCGIACYGYAPSPPVGEALAAFVAPSEGLRPALSLKARVHSVRRLAAGERTSYGRTYALAQDALVADVPLGYADGVQRRLGACGGEVLIAGRRRRIAGTVTMDQLLVDCGASGDVRPGDEVVLIGRQGAEEITAEEWAERLGTIAYEVLCGIGPRVPRLVV